jgi:UDP-N-acetylmuramate--alanine ligase
VINYGDFLDLELPLKQPGMHNRMNAAAALAVAKQEQLDLDQARGTLSQFAGTWRRFEFKGDCNGAPIYDDYGHHPTAIKATIEGARELYPHKKIVVAFQPHTFTRTKELFDDFARAFAAADMALFLPIYAAREENESGVSSRELAVKALEFIPESHYAESFEQAEQLLRQQLTDHDVVIVMGAGDITELATQLTA